MLHTRSRSLAAIATAALLAATLVGCGGSDDKKSDDAKKDATSSASATDGTSGDDGTADIGDDADQLKGDEVDAEDFITEVVSKMQAQKTAHMVIEMGSAMTADADVTYGDKTAMHMKMTTGGQAMDAILLGETMWIRTGTGQKYLKIDKNTPGSENLLGQFKNLGPEQSVTALKGAVKKVVKVGKEKVNGEELTRYGLTVDTAAITKQLGQAVAGADLPKTVTYSMWLNDDGLLSRVAMNVSGQKIVMRVSDWGKKLDIKAPPASQVQSTPAS